MACYSKNTIPRKIIIHGNPLTGGRLIGRSHKLMALLNEDIKTRQQGSRTLHLGNGDKIVCSSCFGVPRIDIYTKDKPSEKKERPKKCFCNCNFSVGTIILVEDIPDVDEYQKLTVAICIREKTYVVHENIIGNDFTPWEEGMAVVVMAYNGFLYDCCNVTFDATGCLPVIDEVNEPHESEYWRTTYRVLPFCAMSFPKWIPA